MPWMGCRENHADPSTRFNSLRLLFLANVDRGARLLPVQVHGASRPRLIEADCEILHRRGQWRHPHVHASKVLSFAGIRNTPLPSLLADDQDPLVGVRYREEGVAPSGNVLATNVRVRARHQRVGVVAPAPPHFAVRHQSAKYLAAFHAWTEVVRLNGLAVRELALGLGRRAGTLARVLGTGQQGEHRQQENDECDTYLHRYLLGKAIAISN